MNALTLTLFVSLGLVVLGLILFLNSYLRGDNEHAERLALLPLADDDPPRVDDDPPHVDLTIPTDNAVKPCVSSSATGAAKESKS